MKRLTVGFLGAALGFAMLAAPVSTAKAQFGLGIFGGAGILTGDIGEDFKTGWLAGVYGKYRFGEGQSPLGVRLDIMYGENNAEDAVATPFLTDRKLKNTYALAHLLVHILPPETSSVDLYFGGGGGFVSSKISVSGTSSESQTDGALSGLFGVGIPVGSGNIKVFFEGKWVTVFTDGGSTNIIPVAAGVAIEF